MSHFQEIIASLGAVSYLGVVGAMFLANTVPGVPEEIFLIALGYMIGRGVFSFWLCLILIVITLFATDNLLYFLSLKGNKIVRTIGNFLMGGTLEKRLPFVEQHIPWIVFFSRFIFQARFLGPFLAGTVKYPWKKFIIPELCALCIYVPITFLLGMYFEDRVSAIIDGIGIVGNIVLIIFALLIVVGIVQLVKKYLFKDINEPDKPKNFFGLKRIEKK